MNRQNTHNPLSLNVTLNDEELRKMRMNHSFWESNAEKFKASNEVSWGDINMMKLEIDNILAYLPDRGLILDAGCSNGFSTYKVAKAKDARIEAFDYSEKAIAIAKSRKKEKDPQDRIRFIEGNILNIPFQDDHFNAAYTIRVLINLPNWKNQKKAILEIHRVLKPGGLYLMSEAFEGSLKKMNALRALAHLKPLKVHEFNLYLKETKCEEFLKPYFDIVAVRKFSSIYYVASRFLRYLTMGKSDKDSFENPINNFFAQYKETENSGDFGIQKLYVLRKKRK
ncbi:MAG TPA: class I SAM-dependent methyltransferase [Candidatus Omnitrophota bacterium]|nr:class I SAM-dependent methyltransferase [Candidatus Omnitrophota bacterium]